jgi:hypothetical protein
MGKLRSRIRERRYLSAQDVASMYDLFERYYDGASRSRFEHDLAGKTHVIELRDGSRLHGFSTAAVFQVDGADAADAHGHRARGIFSGDTIIDREHWGQQELALAFCELAGAVKSQAPDVPLYWLLISKGYRTYRYLHVFARDYFPNFSRPTPREIQRLLDALCQARFGPSFDAATGVVRTGELSGTRLRPEWCTVRDGLRQLPEIAYFLQRNPAFAQGDELACICELQEKNLRSYALRAFRKGRFGLGSGDTAPAADAR